MGRGYTFSPGKKEGQDDEGFRCSSPLQEGSAAAPSCPVS